MIVDGKFDPPYILLDFDSGTKIIVKQNDEQMLLEEYIKREVRKALKGMTLYDYENAPTIIEAEGKE